MKSHINKIFTGLCLAFICIAIQSCNKDDDNSSSAVVLQSFGPVGVVPGQEIKFIGLNLQKVNTIEFVGATVEKAAFTEQKADLIRLNVPQTAQEGYVTLKTTDGDIVTKTIINFEAPVVINSFTPEARPGENVTITGDYLNWVTSIRFADNRFATQFVSQSVNELVVKVPDSAKTGFLLFYSGGTEPLETETATELKVVLPQITDFDPLPAEKGKDVKIIGTNLDLVDGILFKGLTAPIKTFKSKTATQIVLTVPDAANRGPVSAIALSGVATESTKPISFVGDLPPLDPLTYAFYIDALQGNWQNWGWSSSIKFDSQDFVRDGERAIKVEYTGQWGALKFANSSVSTAPYNELTFSVYGTPGTGGKKINLAPSGGSTYEIIIEEGKWVEYKLSKAQIGNPATISDLTFQCQAWTGTVYIDHVGLR
ncbi:IPT/TIG domain-containing protein [Pollutibacter soli]|uniref:IPT/TIG domain-containing protein n=1 Tax=Pollutibacter soli TaxID=3034157 RepID=UPI0030139C08